MFSWTVFPSKENMASKSEAGGNTDIVSKKILSNQPRLQRRGSRLLRYSIAKRIKERENDNMSSEESGNAIIDLDLQMSESESDANDKGGNKIDKPWYIVLPKCVSSENFRYSQISMF